ncbi:MAG: family 10 glycosylhydrolase [Clostridia bacterium]|nr:family 10 glycosylhydrolase [Clostridia bacterium]
MAILGVWMWPTNVRVYGAEKVCAYCARAGVTDIYFLTKGLAGTTAFKGEIAPAGYDYDLFAELLTAAHKKGIRVHAWFTSACDEVYKKLYPESGRCHYTRGKDRELLSLSDAGYLSYMEKITRELCRNYDVDGLHLDYIRYNHMVYGWDEADIRRYEAEGADIAHLRAMMDKAFLGDAPAGPEAIFDAYRAGDESVLAFARARRKDVVHFATALTKLAHAERSDLILSAALMPEGAYDDLAFSDVHYGQNYEDASKLYDYALPMAYSQAYEKDASWVKMVAEGTMKRGMKTIMGLHAYEGGTGLTLKKDIAALKDTAIEGICLFREGATAMAFAQDKKLEVYNTLEKPITKVKATCGEQVFESAEEIAPGTEKQLQLPFAADTLQVYCGEKETSVYLTQE